MVVAPCVEDVLAFVGGSGAADFASDAEVEPPVSAVLPCPGAGVEDGEGRDDEPVGEGGGVAGEEWSVFGAG